MSVEEREKAQSVAAREQLRAALVAEKVEVRITAYFGEHDEKGVRLSTLLATDQRAYRALVARLRRLLSHLYSGER